MSPSDSKRPPGLAAKPAGRGVSATEAALAAPLILTTLAVGYDLTQFFLADMRARETAYRVADSMAADDNVTATFTVADPTVFYKAAFELTKPYNWCGSLALILSGVVYNTDPLVNRAEINWQFKWPTGPSATCAPPNLNTELLPLIATSNLGNPRPPPPSATPGDNPNWSAVLESPITMPTNDTVVVTEIFLKSPQLIFGVLLNKSGTYWHYAGAAARVRNVSDATVAPPPPPPPPPPAPPPPPPPPPKPPAPPPPPPAPPPPPPAPPAPPPPPPAPPKPPSPPAPPTPPPPPPAPPPPPPAPPKPPAPPPPPPTPPVDDGKG